MEWEKGQSLTMFQRWSFSIKLVSVQLLLVRSCCFRQLHAFHFGILTKDIVPPNIFLVPILIAAA